MLDTALLTIDKLLLYCSFITKASEGTLLLLLLLPTLSLKNIFSNKSNKKQNYPQIKKHNVKLLSNEL